MVTCSFVHVEEELPLGDNEFRLYHGEDEAGTVVVVDWYGLPASPGKKTVLPGGRVALPIKETSHDEEKGSQEPH